MPESEVQRGVVKRYRHGQFGFIRPDLGGPDVFVHAQEVARSGLDDFVPGQVVDYELIIGERGPQAQRLKVV